MNKFAAKFPLKSNILHVSSILQPTSVSRTASGINAEYPSHSCRFSIRSALAATSFALRRPFVGNKVRTKRQSPGLQRVRSGEYLNYSEHPYLPPAAFGEWLVSLCRKRFMQNPRVLCTALYNGTCSCVLLPFLLTTPGAFMRHGSWCAVWSSGNLWRHSRNMR